jgi:hypothetical protein
MPEVSFTGQQYRLRAGTPMPTMQYGRFVYHTFMAEVSVVEFVTCTSSLPSSSEFRGQGGNLISASYSRLNTKGGNLFGGKKVFTPSYVDEDSI